MPTPEETTYKTLFAFFHHNSRNNIPDMENSRGQLRIFLEKFFINFTNSQDKKLINHIIGFIILTDKTLIINNDEYEKSMIFLNNIESSDPTNIVKNIKSSIKQVIEKVEKNTANTLMGMQNEPPWYGGSERKTPTTKKPTTKTPTTKKPTTKTPTTKKTTTKKPDLNYK